MAELQPLILFALKRQPDGRRRSEPRKRGSGPGSSLTAGDTGSRFSTQCLKYYESDLFLILYSHF